MTNTTTQSATERADALLTRWGQRLSRSDKQTPPVTAEAAGAAGRADSLLGRVGHRVSGRGMVEAAAYGYVALAIRTGRVADAVQTAWRESVAAARTQQIQQAEQAGGKRAARRAATDERTGENVLKGIEKDVAQDAAQDVEAAAGAAV